MTTDQACENCQFWFTIRGYSGECQRHAPTGVITGDIGRPELKAMWLATDRIDWCGDWAVDKGREFERLKKAARP
jgi:hypothetical protein